MTITALRGGDSRLRLDRVGVLVARHFTAAPIEPRAAVNGRLETPPSPRGNPGTGAERLAPPGPVRIPGVRDNGAAGRSQYFNMADQPLKLETEYPFENHFLDLDGLRYHYLDEGDGPPVVMLHGNPSWSFYYRRLVLALRGEFRCIVPDHIGCGFSEKPGDDRYPYTLKRRVDDLEVLLDHLNPDGPVHLVVHDWGGMIGMAYAHRHPDRIARLVLLNTAAFHLPRSKSFPPLLWVCRTWMGALLIRGGNAFSRAAAHVGCKRNPMSKALRDLYCLPYDSWKNRIATLRFVQDIPLRPGDRGYALVTEVGEALQQFRKNPTLICWGMKDFVFDRHFLDQWSRLLPEARVHRFEDCGHYVLEDAAEEVVPLIVEHLRAVTKEMQ